jgi:hypothetical protein
MHPDASQQTQNKCSCAVTERDKSNIESWFSSFNRYFVASPEYDSIELLNNDDNLVRRAVERLLLPTEPAVVVHSALISKHLLAINKRNQSGFDNNFCLGNSSFLLFT